MFLHLTEDAAAADAVLTDVLLAPTLRRPPEELRGRLLVGSAGECADKLVGSAGECADKLARYEAAGAERVLIWPVGDPLHQLERFHDTVLTRLDAGCARAVIDTSASRGRRLAGGEGPKLGAHQLPH